MPSSSTNVLARLSVDVERLCLPPRAVERTHQRTAQPLAEGMARPRVRRVPRKTRGACLLEPRAPPRSTAPARPAHLLQAPDLRLCERLVGEILERLAREPAPRAPRLSRRAAAAGSGALGFAHEPLEAQQVELFGSIRARHPGSRVTTDLAVAEQASAAASESRALAAAARRTRPPERIDQAVDLDRSLRSQRRNASTARCFGPPSDSRAAPRPLAPKDPGSHRTALRYYDRERVLEGRLLPQRSRRRFVGRGVRLRHVRTDEHPAACRHRDRLRRVPNRGAGRSGGWRRLSRVRPRLNGRSRLKLVAPSLARDERFRERFARESELAMAARAPERRPDLRRGRRRWPRLSRDAARGRDRPGRCSATGSARAHARGGDPRPGRCGLDAAHAKGSCIAT